MAAIPYGCNNTLIIEQLEKLMACEKHTNKHGEILLFTNAVIINTCISRPLRVLTPGKNT
jgi:hypothetical protein